MKRAVLFTGLIRNEPLFLGFLQQYAQLPAERRVPLYLSTWFNELDRYPKVRRALDDLGAFVVEQREPDLVLPGHALHQMTCLDVGLSVIGPGIFVLKSRPDFASMHTYDCFMSVSSSPVAPTRFRYPGQRWRFYAWALFPGHPFYINDINIAGASDDLRLLSEWPMVSSLRYRGISPEQMIWGGSIIPRSGLLDLYFRANLGVVFHNPALNAEARRVLSASPLFARVLAAYYEVLDCCFGDLNVQVPDFDHHAPSLTLEQCLWQVTDVPTLQFNPSAETNSVQTLKFASAVRRRLLRPSPLLDAVNRADEDLKAVDDFDQADHAEAVRLAHDIGSAFQGHGVHGSRIPVGPPRQMGVHAPSPHWRQTGERTARVTELEQEVNMLRRTIDDLQQAPAPGRGSA